MKKKLEIGKTYINKAGDIRKLVRIEGTGAFFENLSKDVDDGWIYQKDGTYTLSVEFQEENLNDGFLILYDEQNEN